MIIPVRCFTCGKPIANFWEEFKTRSEKEDSKKLKHFLQYFFFKTPNLIFLELANFLAFYRDNY